MTEYNDKRDLEQTILCLKEVDDHLDLFRLVQMASQQQNNTVTHPAQSFTDDEKSMVLANTAGACHVCSGGIESISQMEIDWFGSTEHSLAAHKGCLKVRTGATPSIIVIAIKMGFWTMMRAQMEEQKSWIYDFMDQWIEECGNGIGTLVHAPSVSGWNENSSITSRDELTSFTRRLYVYEREAPKFSNQGFSVPDWDPSIDWKYWKQHMHKPIYNQLTRLNERKTLLKGELVLARTGGACALCGADIDQDTCVPNCKLSRDHIFPFCKGGSDCIENLKPLHRFCNAAISSVGVGEIPLSLQMGRWLTDQIGRSKEKWILSFLEKYSKHLVREQRR